MVEDKQYCKFYKHAVRPLSEWEGDAPFDSCF